jgi:hypothetical protein
MEGCQVLRVMRVLNVLQQRGRERVMWVAMGRVRVMVIWLGKVRAMQVMKVMVKVKVRLGKHYYLLFLPLVLQSGKE